MRLSSKRGRGDNDVAADMRLRSPCSHLTQSLEVEGDHFCAVVGSRRSSDNVDTRAGAVRSGRVDRDDANSVTRAFDQPREQEL
jgi:hypothetical protein